MREKILGLIVSIMFGLLILSLFYIQILKGGYYQRLSKNNSIRVIPIDGPRGNIFDRNGVKMVGNRISFDVAITYGDITNKAKFYTLLTETLSIPHGTAVKALNEAGKRPYVSIKCFKDIDRNKAFILEEASMDVDGINIETGSIRDYIYGSAGSHIFGYLGEISEDELEESKGIAYNPKDMTGRSGLEKYYDMYLAGSGGGTQIEVDSRGRRRRVLGIKEPLCGKDLYLTIDARLQKRCDELLGEHSGAIIVIAPYTGEVLALASHPAFDPNVFVEPKGSPERLRLMRDFKGKPLFNRAIAGQYAPGSVFKVVTAAAALAAGKISPHTVFSCSGSYALGKGKFDCWKEHGHGPQDITDALMNSCNVFFYQIGRLAGADNLENFAKMFGFGRITGIDLPDEAKGVVPGKPWKRSHKKEIWYEGDTVNYAIGQGYLLVTPVQILVMTAAIANGGSLTRPYIVKKIGNQYENSSAHRKAGLRDPVIQTIKEGLFEVVNNENGTGKRARCESFKVAGKTGTAENPHGRTHAWFTGFAPFEKPTVSLVVFLEHGGKGGIEPAEIAKAVFEEAKVEGYI